MREDIGELYLKMQARPAPVIYSDDVGGSEIYEVESPGDSVIGDDSDTGTSDDFQLSADVASHVSEDYSADTYSLSSNAPPAEVPRTAVEHDTPEEPAAATAKALAKTSGTNGEPESPAEKEASGSEEVVEEKPDESHSIATGGDALLQIAMEEELESDRRRKHPKKKRDADREITGFLVFCANGHRIEVQDRHRGKAGRCPRCKSLFIVPEKTRDPEPAPDADSGDADTADAAAGTPPAIGRFTRWMSGVHLHKVNPEKLRLKSGSLEKSFEPVELGFSPDDVLIAKLPAAKGLFGRSSGGDAGDEARESLQESLRQETPDDDLPVAEKRLIAADSLQQLGIDQPVIYEHESMFVGIPVFGPGRIAVRLPKAESKDLPTFLSFELTGFREFSQILDQLYGMEEFGSLNEVPLTDEFIEQSCHYSEEKFRSVENVDFYEADEKCSLKLVGRKCAECGLVVSEDARKKEKIGGANGKSIAKATCPKCKKKFGSISLFDLESAAEPETDEEGTAPEESAKTVAAKKEE